MTGKVKSRRAREATKLQENHVLREAVWDLGLPAAMCDQLDRYAAQMSPPPTGQLAGRVDAIKALLLAPLAEFEKEQSAKAQDSQGVDENKGATFAKGIPSRTADLMKNAGDPRTRYVY